MPVCRPDLDVIDVTLYCLPMSNLSPSVGVGAKTMLSLEISTFMIMYKSPGSSDGLRAKDAAAKEFSSKVFMDEDLAGGS